MALTVVVDGLDRLAVVAVAHGDELGLDAGIADITRRRGLLDRALERLARTDVIGRAFPEQVGEDDRHRGVPGADIDRV
jgi:hypothetical protein